MEIEKAAASQAGNNGEACFKGLKQRSRIALIVAFSLIAGGFVCLLLRWISAGILLLMLGIVPLPYVSWLRSRLQNVAIPYAGFWKRLAAIALDLLVILIPARLFGVNMVMVVSISENGKLSSDALGYLGVCVLSWLYFAFMESSAKQATLGKMALGIKVVDLQGNRISFARATVRFFGKFVSAAVFGIGYVMAAYTMQKQALHDIMASCLVVKKAVAYGDLQQAGSAIGISFGAVALAIGRSLIPITFLGILAAVMVPASADYTSRLRMAEVFRVGEQATKAVDEFVAKNNAFPTQMEQIGFSSTSRNVRRIMVNGQNGVILLTTSFWPIMDKTLIFSPSLDRNNKIYWECSSDDIPLGYLPYPCRFNRNDNANRNILFPAK